MVTTLRAECVRRIKRHQMCVCIVYIYSQEMLLLVVGEEEKKMGLGQSSGRGIHPETQGRVPQSARRCHFPLLHCWPRVVRSYLAARTPPPTQGNRLPTLVLLGATCQRSCPRGSRWARVHSLTNPPEYAPPLG